MRVTCDLVTVRAFPRDFSSIKEVSSHLSAAQNGSGLDRSTDDGCFRPAADGRDRPLQGRREAGKTACLATQDQWNGLRYCSVRLNLKNSRVGRFRMILNWSHSVNGNFTLKVVPLAEDVTSMVPP